MKNKQFAVIGLGTFGYNVAVELAQKGVQVLAIDHNEEIVNRISESVTQSFIADAADEKAMKDTGIADCDTAIIAIGENIETNILSTLIVKELGVKNIIVKCTSKWHLKVAAKLGASQVIYPEFEMAKKLVDSLISPNILEQIEIAKGHNLVEFAAPKIYWGKALKDTDIRNKYGINIIAVRRKVPFINDSGQNDIKEEIDVTPGANYEINQNDILIVIGKKESIDKINKGD
ncbi:MAG: TrkA family potassium uptake protein [Elusimicrobiota bacterium]|jgi:trk system potassium uptake protein TrkA|nr:TrkA family potassium uptake protein [Elusimicrobiota bacterium]